VRRIHVPVAKHGAAGTIIFDWKVALHARREKSLCFTLGYNTAIFNLAQRLGGQVNVINMDGIEWHRDKWGLLAKTWFWLNERAGCWLGNHLVADHPEIKKHLASRVSDSKITMIPYGGDDVEAADQALLTALAVEPRQFSIIIARPEPENSFLEMVRAFSSRQRNHKLVVLGNFTPQTNAFHRQVMEAASDEVIFPGAIYDASIVQALRHFSYLYLHGHRVGGTNPSLVEALGAGCAVMAHENHFNRWVAGSGAMYFKNEAECGGLFDDLLENNDKVESMRTASKKQFYEFFTWEQILQEYENLLLRWVEKTN
jgi:glycosyltransferase involved in cell wall biosynthesis